MYDVIKRDGKQVEFNLQKISDAIRKAFDATETEYNEDIIDFLALKVTADFQPKTFSAAPATKPLRRRTFCTVKTARSSAMPNQPIWTMRRR